MCVLVLLPQLATNSCLLRTFDITTMKKEDATFEAPFSITASRWGVGFRVQGNIGEPCMGGFVGLIDRVPRV